MVASSLGTESIISSPAPSGLHIEGMWRFSRPAGFTARTHATDHHLVHLVESGAYDLQLAGRRWAVRAPALIWYHGGEAVGWQGGASAVRFLSCAFACPRLDPPPAARRVVAAPAATATLFRDLIERTAVDGLIGALRSQVAACMLLEALLAAFDLEADDVWERVERHALATIRRPRLAELAIWAGVGISTLERACRRRHGCSPALRLRRLRTGLAQALMAQGGLATPAAARLLGYADRRSLRRAMRGS